MEKEEKKMEERKVAGKKKAEDFDSDDKLRQAGGESDSGKDITTETPPANIPAKSIAKKQLGASLTGPVGLNSISVRLPISGTKYVFSKKIVDKYETYPLTFSYMHTQTQTLIYAALGIVLLLIIVFYIYRRFRVRQV